MNLISSHPGRGHSFVHIAGTVDPGLASGGYVGQYRTLSVRERRRRQGGGAEWPEAGTSLTVSPRQGSEMDPLFLSVLLSLSEMGLDLAYWGFAENQLQVWWGNPATPVQISWRGSLLCAVLLVVGALTREETVRAEPAREGGMAFSAAGWQCFRASWRGALNVFFLIGNSSCDVPAPKSKGMDV